MNFSIRLENLLEEEDLTQKQLALDLHIASSTINGYVKNNREPDFTMPITCWEFPRRRNPRRPA